MPTRGENPNIAVLMKQYDRYEEAASVMFEKFVVFDCDHSSTLDYDECHAYFQEHGLFSGMPPKEVEKFMNTYFSKMDTDGNGALDFGEFMKAHSKLVQYRRLNCLPPIETLSLEKLVAACRRVTEKLAKKQKLEMKHAREKTCR